MLNHKLKLNADLEVLIPACFLHDITAYDNDNLKTTVWKHQEDQTEAKKQLLKIKYSKDKIFKVLACIAVHGSDPKKIKKNESIEATLLRDADKMDVFGPLGVARIIMPMTRHGFDLNQIVQKFYHDGHLKRKWQSIQTKLARNLVRKDYEYSIAFFKELDRQLKS